MTEDQREYLRTLCEETGEPFPDRELTRAEADELLDELQIKAGRLRD